MIFGLFIMKLYIIVMDNKFFKKIIYSFDKYNTIKYRIKEYKF